MTKTKTREQAEKDFNERYFLLKCPHCGTELIVKGSDLHKKLYKPHDEDYEHQDFEDCKLSDKKVDTRKVSSDPDKDVYKNIKCCYCGHVWDEPVKDFYQKSCRPDGSQTLTLELNENETKRVKEFMAKHDHIEEFPFFSGLGQQFTYSITPGGLGPTVSIKCNCCGESEDITDIEDW